MGQSLVKTVCANARKALLHRFPTGGIQARSDAAGIGKGTVERIQNQTATLELGVLETLAKSCNVEPWMLLVPDFDPMAPPMLADVAAEERRILHAVRAIIDRPEVGTSAPDLAAPAFIEDKHKTTTSLTKERDASSPAISEPKKRGRKEKSA